MARQAIQYGNINADFTPAAMPHRDGNSPTIDMNFNLLNQVIRSQKDRITALSGSLTSVSANIASSANPSASVGLAAVNGSASTYMRSDAAPALSQAIVPTWSGLHTFTLAPKVSAFAGGGSLMVTTDNVGQLGTQAIPTGATGANPSATIGLSAVNGAAATFLRSDGAPALSQAIVPTWSGDHTFSTGIYPSYATKGAITYLSNATYSALVPFSSGDWTNSGMTFAVNSITQTNSGGVAHYAYRTYTGGFDDVGKGFYAKYKFTYQNSTGIVIVGVSSATNFVNPGSMKASGANTLGYGQPGGGFISVSPSQSLVAATTYTMYVWYYITSAGNVTMTYQLWDSAGTTYLNGGTDVTSTSLSGTYYFGMYCSADDTAGQLLEVRTYGIDTDSGGGLLTNNSKFVYNDAINCMGLGTSTPAYTLDITGSLRVSSVVLLTAQTASRAVFTSSTSTLTTNAITGSGNVVMSAGPTLTGTITAAIANFSGLVTFNGGATMGSTRFLLAKGADVASANDITLGAGGNFFVITGTTQVNRITTTSWQAGAIIVLKFSGALTLKHQGAATSGALARINLSGSVDYATAANGRITLIYDGTDWWELSRTLA